MLGEGSSSEDSGQEETVVWRSHAAAAKFTIILHKLDDFCTNIFHKSLINSVDDNQNREC